jgi:hypothetical protein
MARWAEMTPHAGEFQEIFMATIFAFHTGKAVAEVQADFSILARSTAFVPSVVCPSLL